MKNAASTVIVVVEGFLKNHSILTSAILLYGPSTKARSIELSIFKTAKAKNPRRIYFSDLKGMSRKRCGFRLAATLFPNLYANSDTVPIGHIQEQKPRLKITAEEITARNIARAAGWTGSKTPLTIKCLKLIKAAIGK